MKITRDKLLESDLNTLFTRDPGTFFEAILINLLWDNEPSSIDQELVARQRFVFERWHEYYREYLIDDAKKILAKEYEPKLQRAYRNGELSGRIKALEELPVKKSGFGKIVDLIAVADTLKQLKAVEPKGVNDAEGTTD